MCERIVVSSLPKTWILDLDGTLVKHNGYKIDGYDSLLPGACGLLESIGPEDMVIIVTSRTEEYREMTVRFLHEQGIGYTHIVFGAPYGERILVNDRKPSGLPMAVAINTERDAATQTVIAVDEAL